MLSPSTPEPPRPLGDRRTLVKMSKAGDRAATTWLAWDRSERDRARAAERARLAAIKAERKADLLRAQADLLRAQVTGEQPMATGASASRVNRMAKQMKREAAVEAKRERMRERYERWGGLAAPPVQPLASGPNYLQVLGWDPEEVKARQGGKLLPRQTRRVREVRTAWELQEKLHAQLVKVLGWDPRTVPHSQLSSEQFDALMKAQRDLGIEDVG